MNITQQNLITLILTMLSVLGITALTCLACMCNPIADFPLTPPPAPSLPTMVQDEYVSAPVEDEADVIEEYEETIIPPPITEEYVVAAPVAAEEVVILEEPIVEVSVRQPRYTLTAAEKHLLKFVADREDSHSVESRLAVMQVVMNRVNDGRFPNTVRDVLFQQSQFHVMPRYHTGYVPSAQAHEALERLLYGTCIFGGANAIFFAASRVSPDRIARRLYLIAEIGGSRFWGQRAS